MNFIINTVISLLGFLNDFHQAPPLCLAHRAGLHDLYDIPDGALILLIMSVEAGSLLYELTIDRVLHLPFDSHSDGLIHLIALHHPDPRFAQISFNHCFAFYAFLTFPRPIGTGLVYQNEPSVHCPKDRY